ncbi:hypothetical protein OF83DRAFT_85700 [Amylostereum chailletii]|nr:hypothetical protein OF83DRAFT_85700 [Amylostereum chailletii]
MSQMEKPLEFTSAERLMEPSIFLRGLLRDDIESFVYVLVYHVLRYRPAGFPSATLAHHLHHIFNQHIVVDGQYSGGEWKADYLRGGSYFTPTALIDSTLPSQLVALMNALRYLFFFTYTSNAVLRMMRIPTSIVEKGLRVLDTADEVTAIFEAHLKLDGWPEDDGADDQLRSFDPTKTTGRRFV